MKTYQKEIGDIGEGIAAQYLEGLGYQLLERNYKTRYGELDLIMMDLEDIVFVEVKTRTSDTFGMPESSISTGKLGRLQNAALLWLQEHPDASDNWRIDVIAILIDRLKNVKDLQHFVNVQ